jgi:hypothetical protein
MLPRVTTAWFAGFAVLAPVILTASLSAAQPAGRDNTSCVGTYRSFSCVEIWSDGSGEAHIRSIPQPGSDQESVQSRKREEQWQARCRPVVKQDEYGVARYRYAAPGCDLGRLE